MPYFEVFIPATAPEAMNLVLVVEAENWLGALRTGLASSGEEQASSKVTCDVQDDNSMHVTDHDTDRVFRLREVEAPTGGAGAPAPKATNTTGRFQTAPQPITRTELKPAATDPTFQPRVDKVDVDDAIADIFDRTMELYGERLNPDRIVNELLDLAMEKIPSDAGTFYVANISSHDLQFAAVRGPKAKEILQADYRVPMGKGIAGMCAQENVSLIVGDATKDPRFLRELSDKIGYEAHSMLCVPMDKDGRCYGAIQLINKKGATHYSKGELNILAAVSAQAVELLSQVQT